LLSEVFVSQRIYLIFKEKTIRKNREILREIAGKSMERVFFEERHKDFIAKFTNKRDK